MDNKLINAVQDYLNKGPEHMKAHVTGIIEHIKQLTDMMLALLEDDPITAILVGFRIETKVYDRDGTVLFESMIGDEKDARSSDTDAD